jgi:hypothetical protein
VKRILQRCLLWILLLLCLPLLICWYVFTVPSWKSNTPSSFSVSENSLRAHVRFLSQQCHPRNFQQLENLAKAAQYIEAQFQSAGLEVERQTYSDGIHSYTNILGRMGTANAPLVVVGAHYDSFKDTPGADENASGVAGLIELARLCQDDPPPLRLEFVAYTLEEPPYFRSESMGSSIHAASLAKDDQDVHLMVCLEMIEYFDSEPGSQQYPLRAFSLIYPSHGDFIAVVGKASQRSKVKQFYIGMKKATPLPVIALAGLEIIPGLDFSDHMNYWQHDYPAIMITNTSFYRNHEYHTTKDTWEQLDYAQMGNVVVSVFEALGYISP